MTTATLFLKRSIKSAASIAGARVGPRAVPGSINIFAYHRVVKDIQKAESEAIYGIVISASSFRRHCEILKKRFDVVSLETATHFLHARRQVARPLAVITFDDGYLDFYEEAFPVLSELGLPATVFLPTGCIGKKEPLAHDRIFWLLKQARECSIPVAEAFRRAGCAGRLRHINGDLLKMSDAIVFMPSHQREKVIAELEIELKGRIKDYPTEYRLLDWDMVREMARKGISFGAHTSNHVVLPLEDVSVRRDEVIRSKRELEQQLGSKIASFAYPNGAYDPEIRQLIAQAGFKVAVTTETRVNVPGADLLALGRTSLCEESTRGIRGYFSPGVANLRLGA